MGITPTTVISFCALDRRFIEACILQSGAFSHEVVVVYADHRFDGSLEDLGPIDELKPKYPLVKFIQINWNDSQPPRYWHNVMRWAGKEASMSDWILFLDADEVPEGELLRSYLSTLDPTANDAYVFACYWYFREPTLQANKTEECGLLIRKSLLDEGFIFSEEERWECRKRKNQIRLQDLVRPFGRPLLHHYSWVRTKDEMLSKVASWGHKFDRDWASMIEEEFQKDFQPTFGRRDFVHHYTYCRVINRFDINI